MIKGKNHSQSVAPDLHVCAVAFVHMYTEAQTHKIKQMQPF